MYIFQVCEDAFDKAPVTQFFVFLTALKLDDGIGRFGEHLNCKTFSRKDVSNMGLATSINLFLKWCFSIVEFLKDTLQ